MNVMEVYKAPQGEGLNIGVPSIFVRLQGCPVGCAWCDIKQSWTAESQGSYHATPQEVAHQVQSLAGFEIDHVVITGGEPLAQRKDVERFVNLLRKSFHVEIETSGIYKPLRDVRPQYNVSPKMPSAASKVKPSDILVHYVDEKAIFKFVVQDHEDFVAARQTCDKYGLPYSRVFLMPEGIDRDTIIERMRWLEELILMEWPQVRMTTRLHILMHQNERKR